MMQTSTNPAGSAHGPAAKHKATAIDKEIYRLRLYVMGMSRQSVQALTNLKQVCDKYLADRYELEVIDLQRHPEFVAEEGFVVAPMLVRNAPLPTRKIIGDLADTHDLLCRLDISPLQ